MLRRWTACALALCAATCTSNATVEGIGDEPGGRPNLGSQGPGEGAGDSDSPGSDEGQTGDTHGDEDSGSGGGSGGETEPLPPSPGSFELGWGEDSFTPLVDQGELELVLGGQGLWMFPMPIHGEGFFVPETFEFDDPDTPRLTLRLEIEDYESAFGPYFGMFNDHAIEFEVLEDASYEHMYLPVIAPNDFVDICSVVGHVAHLDAELQVAGGGAPLSFSRTMKVTAPAGTDPGCD